MLPWVPLTSNWFVLPVKLDNWTVAQIDLKRSLPHPKKTRKIFVGGLGADVDDGALCSVTSCIMTF